MFGLSSICKAINPCKNVVCTETKRSDVLLTVLEPSSSLTACLFSAVNLPVPWLAACLISSYLSFDPLTLNTPAPVKKFSLKERCAKGVTKPAYNTGDNARRFICSARKFMSGALFQDLQQAVFTSLRETD